MHSREDGVTIFKIVGLDDYPRAYKVILDRLSSEIQRNETRILASGQHLPVIRTLQSVEIH